MSSKSLWSEKNEYREIVFLYNRLIENESYISDVCDGRNYSIECNETISIKPSEMVKELDDFIFFDAKFRDNTIDDWLSLHDLNYRRTTKDEYDDAKDNLLMIFNKCCLGSGCFDWISIHEDRLINYAWSSVLLIKRRDAFRELKYQSISITDFEYNRSTRGYHLKDAFSDDVPESRSGLYSSLRLNINPISNKDKLANLIKLFDLSDARIEDKEDFIEKLECQWNKIKNNSKVIEWLSKNEVISTWAWDYVFEKYLNGSAPVWLKVDAPDADGINRQKRDALITFYDLLKTEHKQLVIMDLRKYGAQQKYRLKQQSKDAPRKTVQISMGVDVKEKLEKLAKSKGVTMNRIIENLINKEYRLFIDNENDS